MEPEQLGLEFLFQPKSIALVGIPSNSANPLVDMFLRPLVEFGFAGELYPVNPKGSKVLGLEFYPSIKDIPGAVDYVIGAVPARFSHQVTQDCAAKGVKAISFYTAGFSETGEESGAALEAEIVNTARRGGVRVLGPNCMGIYCPKGRLAYWPDFPKESGPVAYLCQSGGNSIHLVWMGAPRGIRFSKVISFGNACDLNEADFLDYFTYDPDTRIIAAYIEGVKDGRQFLKVLSKAAEAKPVIILKGGRSEAGTKAAASHTGALTTDDATWDALCKQLGVIQVSSMEELADVIVTFLFLPPCGRNVAIVTAGGGVSVLAADDCESSGLAVPPLPAEIQDQLRHCTTGIGNILRNPVDLSDVFFDPQGVANALRIISSWQGIDLLILPLIGGVPLQSGRRMSYDVLVDIVPNWGTLPPKPTAIVVQPGTHPDASQDAFRVQQEFASAGFPVYPTMVRAAKAINKFISYHQRRGQSQQEDRNCKI